MAACAESFLQKGPGADEPSPNTAMRALCHISRSTILQETTSKDPARNISPLEIGNVMFSDPDEPSGLAGAHCIKKSWKENAGTQEDLTLAPLKVRSIMNSVHTTERQPSDKSCSNGPVLSLESRPRV
jgi:hypothetical protein